jgi:hypothetical protein
MPGVSVVCALWVGPVNGDRLYTPLYVERLADMAKKNLSIEHDFTCFTNVPAAEFRPDLRVVPLVHGWPLWWSKMETMRAGVLAGDVVINLDLDILIVKSLDPFLAAWQDGGENFAAMNYWSYSGFRTRGQARARMRASRGRECVPRLSSDLMIYRREDGEKLFTEFEPQADEFMARYCGDQDVIGVLRPEAGRFPRSWGRKIRRQELGEWPLDFGEAKILACHPIKNHRLAEQGYTYLDRIWSGHA